MQAYIWYAYWRQRLIIWNIMLRTNYMRKQQLRKETRETTNRISCFMWTSRNRVLLMPLSFAAQMPNACMKVSFKKRKMGKILGMLCTGRTCLRTHKNKIDSELVLKSSIMKETVGRANKSNRNMILTRLINSSLYSFEKSCVIDQKKNVFLQCTLKQAGNSRLFF